MATREFEFRVIDENGTWGDIKVRAKNREKAALAIRKSLDREETEPNGSLLPDYRLVPLTATKAEVKQ